MTRIKKVLSRVSSPIMFPMHVNVVHNVRYFLDSAAAITDGVPIPVAARRNMYSMHIGKHQR
ncbi:hypothetical protein MHIR_DE00621 [Candidatus Doolittlea endobia]|uniref:Uncharacterized protein n=1 Tax=Candidatus Doolittlea endobia TaxID=1778262 RepID=A0A143WVD5_9ENTR|nr:hypothetical protein MHIR_DE00621 [Candidatus Doolittlea endobia]